MENTYQYQGPEGNIVETTSHEFATRLKGMGYVRVEAPAESLNLSPDLGENEDGKAEQVEVVPEVEEVVTPRPRRRNPDDDIRG